MHGGYIEMNIVCIMGRSASGKSLVEKTLEGMGYTRSISYTTREPQVRNGKLEENGKDYRFVTEDKFMKLVESGKIIEFERYNGNLYGTPRPFGVKRLVAVVCLGGYRALKELYGEQVTGIYLKVDEAVAEHRGDKRDLNNNNISDRKEQDGKLTAEMENTADVIIDANQDINRVIYDIIKAIRLKEY